MNLEAVSEPDMYLPEFRRAARYRNSWACCVPGFEAVLKDLRSNEVPPEDEQHGGKPP